MVNNIGLNNNNLAQTPGPRKVKHFMTICKVNDIVPKFLNIDWRIHIYIYIIYGSFSQLTFAIFLLPFLVRIHNPRSNAIIFPGRRLTGSSRKPVYIRRCTRHLMPGILDRMACGVALALAIRGRAKCRRPPRGKKAALF